MDKFSDIFDQLDIYDIVLIMIQRVGSIERTEVSASEFMAERDKLNRNLALFDIQKTTFENRFSVKAGYSTSIDNLILSCIMELAVEKQGEFLERLSLSCEKFEYCSPEEWTDFLNVLGRSSESRERYDDDMNFARFVVQRTNYLRKQIPAIVSQFTNDTAVETVIEDSMPPEAADLFDYDVEM